MDTSINVLAAEVDRIVNSPYPTQLKKLHDIAIHTEERDICFWARCYPCRISDLCRALVDALPTWPYVLDMITRLSCSPLIRDSLLEIEPSLLDEVVTKAASLQPGSRRFLDLSIALLSHKLPDSVACPESAQKLLLQLVERAVAQPDFSTVQPIYQLLNGACTELIGILSVEILSELEERLMSIMRTLTLVKNKTPTIYCLAIMKAVLDQLDTTSQPTPTLDGWDELDSSRGGEGQQRISEDLSRLFRGNRAHKTLSLLTLHLVWACTPGTVQSDRTEQSEPEATLLNSCIMANEILFAIGSSVREDWCRQNSPLLGKLQARSLLPSVSESLRFQALTFLAYTSGAATIPANLVAAYGQSLLNICNVLAPNEQIDYALKLCLPRFARSLDNRFWESLVSKLLDLVIEPKIVSLLVSDGRSAILLDRLAAVLEESRHCRQSLNAAMSITIRPKFEHFLASPAPLLCATQAGDCCTRAATNNLNNVVSSFCGLILRSSLAAHQDETQLSLSLLPELLKKHLASGSNQASCSSCTRRRGARQYATLFVEVESTPDVENTSLPWKERLARKMDAQAREQRQAMVASFAEVCRSLEERCDVGEAPLRQEQQKLEALQSRYDLLTTAFGELETQVMDRDLRINALEAEKDGNLAQLESISDESREMAQKLDGVTRELQQAMKDSRMALDTAKQEYVGLELEHATTIACKQELLDKTKEDLQNTHLELQKLRSQFGLLEEGGKQNDVQRRNLQMSLREAEQKLQEHQDTISRHKEEISSLEQLSSNQKQELTHVQEVRSNLERHIELLQAEIGDTKAESKRAIERMATSFEEATSNNKQEWLDMKAKLEQQLEDVRGELVQAEDGFHDQQEANKHKTAELRKRIDRLSKECQRKDAQIVEAQEMRNRLMNAMGLGGALPAALPAQEPSTKSSTLPYRSASTMATPRPSSQPVLSTPARGADDIGLDEEEDELYNSDVSSDHGPTPKRPRPRQPPGRSVVNPQLHSAGRRSVKSVLRTRSASKRVPLLDLDANQSPFKGRRSPSKVAFKSNDKELPSISTAERRDLEEWSFDATDVLTGTQGGGLRLQMDDLEEESTADV